jgi:mitogen-activated protein kinase 1/3
VDKVTGRKVVIKKINHAFDDLKDAKRIVREVKLLRHFHHENIIRIHELAGPVDANCPFDDLYIVLDFMEADLHKIIYSKNELTDEHIQYFMYQILKALKCIHSAQVVHCDLKPSNIWLNGNCDLKVCDFGLARRVNQPPDADEYVVARWHRAPEVICGEDFDCKSDMWSVCMICTQCCIAVHVCLAINANIYRFNLCFLFRIALL